MKLRAPRNRTITLTAEEQSLYKRRLLRLSEPLLIESLTDKTICQNVFEATPFLPDGFVDLLIVDPPYNLDKSFNENKFKSLSSSDYAEWIDRWLGGLRRVLKPTASIYICSDWRSSAAVQQIAEKYFCVQNRITWEREKGRGALSNWKNCSEDIWFCTVGREYNFNVEAVKLKRKVIAPYTNGDGAPKDWQRSDDGDFRLTYPSNLWTDISVPFWSMPENTDHPTQKPEKLIAKLILASSNPGDLVFDPFLGSGTTSVVAKKLGRHFVGIEQEELYCCLVEKRLEMALEDSSVQGYHDSVFWERNTLSEQKKDAIKIRKAAAGTGSLFDGEGWE